MHLERRHLVLVTTIADTGSLSAAAAALGISQPGISAQLARLENQLGGQLFERGRRGATPTPLGDLVVDRATAILNAFEELAQDARRHATQGPALRIAANRSNFCGSLLAGLTAALPGRLIQPSTFVSSANMCQALAACQLDLAVIGIHPGIDAECDPRMTEIEFVSREPMLIAMSTEHPLARQVEVDFADLLQLEWLLPPGRPSATYTALLALFEQYGAQPRSTLGRQVLSYYSGYVAASETVAIALPTYPPPPGIAVRPIKGDPLVGKRVLRGRPEALSPEEFEICREVALQTYREEIQASAARQPWWHQAPEHRPVITGESLAMSEPLRNRGGTLVDVRAPVVPVPR